jgi:hypothetical protein
MLELAMKAKRKEEDPMWTVRERIAARAGRLHMMRAVRRAAVAARAPKAIKLPSSDEDAMLPKKKRRERDRRRDDDEEDGRSKRGRDRDRDRRDRRRRRRSDSTSRSSSTSSARDFRGAPSHAAGSLAQRDAQEKPHVVLVETLEEITRSLPRSCEGASMTRAELYRKLPAVMTAWFSLKLEDKLRGQGGSLRSLREAKTLVEVADDLLLGQSLPCLMKVLGRLKALTETTTGRSWEVAQHHELVETENAGMLTRRDRENAAKSIRAQQKLSVGGRGAPMGGAPVQRA